MQEALLAVLCVEARQGGIRASEHYLQRILGREMPGPDDISYVLCEDQPEVIEENRPVHEATRPSSLIWGIMENGRIGHIKCSHPPYPVLITAYWPDTEPDEWADDTYRRRATS